MNLPRIAVDAMGGDEGVRVMVEGAALARRDHDKFKFLLVGDKARIEAALANHPNLRAASEILHCEDVVGGDELPSKAIRRAKCTSMGLAVNAVKTGDAGAAVSAGNTGALMARWTNDEWRATAHRVVAGPPEVASKDRYSIAFFFDPDKESVIETHPACLARTGEEAKYASISAKDFVMMKIMEMQKTAAEAGVKAAY